MLRASISCRKKLQSKMFDKHKNHESHSSKTTKRMHTSRAALNRLLDKNDASLTLTTLASAAAALGKKVNLQLAAAWPTISIALVNFFTVKFEHPRGSLTNGISKFSVPSWSRTLALCGSSPGCGVKLYVFSVQKPNIKTSRSNLLKQFDMN